MFKKLGAAVAAIALSCAGAANAGVYIVPFETQYFDEVRSQYFETTFYKYNVSFGDTPMAPNRVAAVDVFWDTGDLIDSW